jgi:hypothetical protein
LRGVPGIEVGLWTPANWDLIKEVLGRE